MRKPMRKPQTILVVQHAGSTVVANHLRAALEVLGDADEEKRGQDEKDSEKEKRALHDYAEVI